MRLELLGSMGPGPETARGEIRRDIGAAVVRASPGGGVVLELGPADGPPHLRLVLTGAEAMRLSATLQSIANGRGEEILIVDE